MDALSGVDLASGGIDPAWFYSTIAQVSAAIVGLFGAIIITRVIDEIGRTVNSRATIVASLGEMKFQFDQRKADIESLVEALEEEIAEDDKAIAKGRDARQARVPKLQNLGEPSYPVDPKAHILPMRDQRNFAQSLLGIYQQSTRGIVTSETVGDFVTTLTQAVAGGDHSTDTKGIVGIDARDIKKELFWPLKKFTPRPFPGSYVWVLILLAIIAVGGVIGPLVFLPGFSDDPWRTWIFGALAVGLVGLLAVFAWELVRLYRLREFRWEHRE